MNEGNESCGLIAELHAYREAHGDDAGWRYAEGMIQALLHQQQHPRTATPVQVSRRETALYIIARHSCERLTTGPGSCWAQEAWTVNAPYGADCWCLPCIALAALRGQPLRYNTYDPVSQ